MRTATIASALLLSALPAWCESEVPQSPSPDDYDWRPQLLTPRILSYEPIRYRVRWTYIGEAVAPEELKAMTDAVSAAVRKALAGRAANGGR